MSLVQTFEDARLREEIKGMFDPNVARIQFTHAANGIFPGRASDMANDSSLTQGTPVAGMRFGA